MLEVFQIIPPLLIAILLSTLTGGGVIELILIISFTGWMGMCRLVRADMLTMREEEYVLAARAVGRGTIPDHFPASVAQRDGTYARCLLTDHSRRDRGGGRLEPPWGGGQPADASWGG